MLCHVSVEFKRRLSPSFFCFQHNLWTWKRHALQLEEILSSHFGFVLRLFQSSQQNFKSYLWTPLTITTPMHLQPSIVLASALSVLLKCFLLPLFTTCLRTTLWSSFLFVPLCLERLPYSVQFPVFDVYAFKFLSFSSIQWHGLYRPRHQSFPVPCYSYFYQFCWPFTYIQRPAAILADGPPHTAPAIAKPTMR